MTRTQVFLEELVQLLLLGERERVYFAIYRTSTLNKLDNVIPWAPFRQLVEIVFVEQVAEIVIDARDALLEGRLFLGLCLLLGYGRRMS